MRLPIAVPALLLALPLASAPEAAAPEAAAPEAAAASFLVVNPGGRGNQTKAQGFLRDLAQALAAAWPADAAPPPDWTGNYHVTEADALASIRKRRPAFALVTPGFLEAHAGDLGLVPVAVPVRPSEAPRRLQLVVRADDAGTAARLEAGALAGLRFGGQACAEPAWTRAHVLAPLGAAEGAMLVAHERSLESVRALQHGDVDVALLEDDDWKRLVELGRAEGLRAARATPVLPEGPAVALADPAAPPAQREAALALGRAAGRALARLHEIPEGRAVLERMTLARFDLRAGSD